MENRAPRPMLAEPAVLGADEPSNGDFHRELPAEIAPLVKIRSWRSVLPGLLAYFGACLLAVPVSQRFPETVLNSSFEIFGQQYSVSMPLFGLIAAVLLIRPLFLMYDGVHTITAHHVRSTLGRCSLKRVDIEVAYEDIRGVSIDQSVLDRILGVGTLHLWTALNASPEISMQGISNPKALADVIRSQIDHNRIKRQLAAFEPMPMAAAM